MKRFSAGVLAAASRSRPVPLVAQQKPNFSGNWTINQAKSNFGAVPVPMITRKIVHAEPSLTIDEEQDSQPTQRKTSPTAASRLSAPAAPT